MQSDPKTAERLALADGIGASEAPRLGAKENGRTTSMSAGEPM
jgi:hypothetical protein